MASTVPLVLWNVGLLARFDLVDLVAAQTDLSTQRAGARWFVLPRPLSGSTPDLDGTPMPVGADGWLELTAVPDADEASSASMSVVAHTVQTMEQEPSVAGQGRGRAS
jgi:hypothetical protein